MAKKSEITVVDINRKNITSNPSDKDIVPYKTLDVKNKIERINCKLCQSEFRNEAEEFYEKNGKNYKRLQEWLEKKNVIISFPSVRNHIIYHFKAQERNESLVEYSSDIKKWIDNQPDKIRAIKVRMAILEKEMVNIAASGEDLPIDERRKNADVVKKLADTLLIYQDKLDKISEQMEPVMIVVNQLKIIVNDEIKNNNNEQIKRVLASIMEKLKNNELVKEISGD
jgi:hypothetical protein